MLKFHLGWHALLKKEGAASAELTDDPGAAETNEDSIANETPAPAETKQGGQPPGAAGKHQPERKGVFTSAILSRVGQL